MTASQRIRRAALPTIMAAVIGVGGFAVGAAAAGPGDPVRPPPAAATTLAQVLASQEPGQVVSVTVDRDGADHSVRLTLGELPGG